MRIVLKAGDASSKEFVFTLPRVARCPKEDGVNEVLGSKHHEHQNHRYA